MTTLQYIASIALLGLGGLFALINAWVLMRQLLGRSSPSTAPLIGGVLLFTGALLLPGGHLRSWAVAGLFLDYGCVPYLALASISMVRETRRHAIKNRILSLRYDAGKCAGEIHLYPENECTYTWAAKDGLSRGSILMKVDAYDPRVALKLSIQDTRVSLVMRDDRWQLDSERGWHDPVHSLANATITEVASTDRQAR